MSSEIKGVGVNELRRFIQDNPDWLVMDHSQLEKFESCPRRYKYEYRDKLAKITSFDTEFGNVLHAIMSDWYINGPEWQPTSQWFGPVWQRFQERTADALPPPANRMAVFTQQHARRCFDEYIRRYRTDFELYEVETSEVVYFREIIPGVLWLSKPDLVLRRIADRKRTTLDFKHSVWEFNRSLLSFDRQFIGQAFAAESEWMIKAFFHSQVSTSRSATRRQPVDPLPQILGIRDQPPDGASSRVAIYRPTEPVDGELVDEWLEETREMMEYVKKCSTAGVWPKRAPRACSDFNRLCEFHDLCEMGKRTGQVVIDSREKVNPNEYLGL